METELLNPGYEILDFNKEKVLPITLDQLKRTNNENDVYGKPLRGIYHYELIENLQELCDKHNLKFQLNEIFAAQNSDKLMPGATAVKQLEAQLGAQALEAYILRRIFANITICDFDDPTYTTNLAVAFHQKGIQIGFGNMVKVCHNQCILNADSMVSNYTITGLHNIKAESISGLLNVVEGWLANAENTIMTERKQMEDMKNIDINMSKFKYLLGALVECRVKHDTQIKAIRDNSIYPLSNSQINLIAEHGFNLMCEIGTMNAYNFYNMATDLFKPKATDVPNIIPQNVALANFMKREQLLAA